MGRRSACIRYNEKLAALRKLVAWLIWHSVSEIAVEAQKVRRQVYASPSNLNSESIEKLVIDLASDCVRISPGSRSEIIAELPSLINNCSTTRGNAKEVLLWLKEKFVRPPSKAFYYPPTSELAHIRQIINLRGLPADADIAVLLPENKNPNRVPSKTAEGRSWFKPQEVTKNVFEEIKTADLKRHLVFVEKLGQKYVPLLIVVPPSLQGEALRSNREVHREMFTKMVEIPLGSRSTRNVDKGAKKNEIYMWGYRWTRNCDYCWLDKSSGPFTLPKAARRNVPRLRSFEEAMECFVGRMSLVLEAVSPEYATLHRTHIADVNCGMPGSSIFNQMCCTRDYHNRCHVDSSDQAGSLSVGMWLLCGTDGRKVSAKKALTRFVLSDYGISLVLSDGIVLIWAADRFMHCTVPIKNVMPGARPWVLGSAMYIKPKIIGAKDGQDRRRNKRPAVECPAKAKRPRTSRSRS